MKHTSYRPTDYKMPSVKLLLDYFVFFDQLRDGETETHHNTQTGFINMVYFTKYCRLCSVDGTSFATCNENIKQFRPEKVKYVNVRSILKQ